MFPSDKVGPNGPNDLVLSRIKLVEYSNFPTPLFIFKNKDVCFYISSPCSGSNPVGHYHNPFPNHAGQNLNLT